MTSTRGRGRAGLLRLYCVAFDRGIRTFPILDKPSPRRRRVPRLCLSGIVCTDGDTSVARAGQCGCGGAGHATGRGCIGCRPGSDHGRPACAGRSQGRPRADWSRGADREIWRADRRCSTADRAGRMGSLRADGVCRAAGGTLAGVLERLGGSSGTRSRTRRARPALEACDVRRIPTEGWSSRHAELYRHCFERKLFGDGESAYCRSIRCPATHAVAERRWCGGVDARGRVRHAEVRFAADDVAAGFARRHAASQRRRLSLHRFGV